MARTIPFRIGARATCTDGACGLVSRIIVNPVAREVTHLAVDPKHRRGVGRLVPVDLADATTGRIRLCCTLAEFQALRPAQQTETVPDLDPSGHHDSRPDLVKWVISPTSPFLRRRDARDPRGPGTPQQVTVDSVPSGEVDIRRELIVRATDGEIGQARGLLVEPGGHQVTHVLLKEGHLRGRKEVAIPIGAVTKIGILLVHLSLTRRQVKDLPPADTGHPGG